jgi:hypothetical protein
MRTPASIALYLTAFVIAAPITTTQVMTASVIGGDQHAAALGRSLGRGPRDCHGVGPHLARCGHDRRHRVPLTVLLALG